VFRDNLANFMRLFDKMDAAEQREMIRLVVMEAVYDKAQSVMRLGLLPFQSFDWPQERYGANFVDCIKTLPVSNGLRNRLLQINPLFEPENEINEVLLWDGSDFGRVNGAKGLGRILSPQEAQEVRSRQRRYLLPKPPLIQVILRRAHELQARLTADHSLTRESLAKESGLNPGHLTRLLRLADLAPEIQHYILALPPSIHRGVVTERRLRSIAAISEHGAQLERFYSLLTLPVRAQKKSTPVASPPSHRPLLHLGA